MLKHAVTRVPPCHVQCLDVIMEASDSVSVVTLLISSLSNSTKVQWCYGWMEKAFTILLKKINFLLFSFVVIFPFSCQYFHSVSHRKKTDFSFICETREHCEKSRFFFHAEKNHENSDKTFFSHILINQFFTLFLTQKEKSRCFFPWQIKKCN